MHANVHCVQYFSPLVWNKQYTRHAVLVHLIFLDYFSEWSLLYRQPCTTKHSHLSLLWCSQVPFKFILFHLVCYSGFICSCCSKWPKILDRTGWKKCKEEPGSLAERSRCIDFGRKLKARERWNPIFADTGSR